MRLSSSDSKVLVSLLVILLVTSTLFMVLGATAIASPAPCGGDACNCGVCNVGVTCTGATPWGCVGGAGCPCASCQCPPSKPICNNLMDYYLPCLAVGGVTVSIDNFDSLAPYIGFTSTIIVAAVATSIYIKRVKRRKEK